jgi:hypothetical protein
MGKFKTTRDINSEECHWIDEPVKEGTEVYEYFGHTYGCISSSGMAVTLKEGELPFFELPYNSLIEIEKE